MSPELAVIRQFLINWNQILACSKAAVLAVLLSVAPSEQACGQSAKTQVPATNQQPPAHDFPVPLPVQIIEDQARSDAAARRDHEADLREIEGLLTQKGMELTAKATNAATEDMRDYALYSTCLVAIGTVLLFVTLALTWQANRAALAAVEITGDIGRRQVRAYVGVTHVKAEHRMDGRQAEDINFTFILTNSGHSPALDVSIWGTCFFNSEFPEDKPINDGSVGGRNPIAPGAEIKIEFSTTDKHFPIEAVQALRAGKTRLWVCGLVEYADTFGRRQNVGFRFEVERGPKRYPKMIPCERGNYSS